MPWRRDDRERKRRLKALRSSHMFNYCNDEDLIALLPHMKLETYTYVVV